METFARGIMKFKWLIIIAVIGLTILFGVQIPNLGINSDVIESLPDDDPDALLLKRIAREFGGNSIGMVILETDDIFQPEPLEHMRLLTDSLGTIDGISSVTSLTNIIDIKEGGFGIEVGKLIDEYNMPQSEEELKELKARIFSKDMYRGSMVSDDGTAAVVIFTLAEGANPQVVTGDVKRHTEALNLPEKIYYAGSPVMVTTVSELISTDLLTLIPISFLVIAIILFFGFKSIRGVIMPLLTAGIATVWTMGIMSMVGYKMSMVSNNIPIILLAVGSAYTIHVLNRIRLEREKELKKAIVRALAYIIIPVFLATVTTMIGFLSFIFGAYLNMIRDFGIFTSIGTAIASLLSIFFVPAIISLMKARKRSQFHPEMKNKQTFLARRFLIPLKNLLYLQPRNILITWGALIIVSTGGIFMIERSVDINDYFKNDNPTRIAEELMTKKFGGSKPVFVHFKGDMHDPEVLKTMLRAEAYMKESPDIYSTQSIADLIAQMIGILEGTEEIPDERAKIEQLWFLLDGQEYLQRFISEDLTEGVILYKFTSSDNKSKKEFSDYMETFINEYSTEECRIQITGMPFVDLTMDKSLINSQFGSLSIAIVFVVIIVGLILRSFKSGIYASIPIIASIVILFGLMGYIGISLNIATVLVASLTLGIGIDYSIHVITHFNHSYKRGGDVYRALRDVILISGKAIIINILSVAGGFLVLLFSEMVPLQYFGLLISISMIASGLGALTLLPVILILIHRKGKLVKYS